ncbi:MAG: S8 family serine peptidase, partial [Prochloraceae cyanobacterium]
MSNDQASEKLNIALTFPDPSNNIRPTRFGTRITSELAPDLKPDFQVTARALEELERRGFTVTSKGRLTVSIRGSKEDFERVFGTQLTRITLEPDEFTRRRSADSVLYPAADAPWNPETAIADLIDDAYIQWPYIYMNQQLTPTLIPPQVNYHHLRVPGDVVMLLNAAKVHREGTTGKGIRVAMIDSGFAHQQHPYFGEMGYNTSVVLAPGATDSQLDGNGHGTGESANLLALAPDVTFIGVKLDNEQSSDQSASILEGFQTALEHNPHIISVSLGYDLRGRTTLPGSLVALELEIAEAVANGIVVVFASGNGHVAFPGMMPDVISAGGVYVNETGEMRASDYASAFASRIYPGRNVPDFCGLVGLASNNADYIMLPIQPGCDIDRDNSQHDGTGAQDGWGVFSGTSAAAPQIAGICALLL